jgi:hypothetical protein
MRVFLCGVIGVLWSFVCFAATTETVVAAAYPPQLSEIAGQHHYEEQREQAYARISAAGTDYVVAAYTNGHVGAISLINTSANPATTTQLIRDHQTGVHPRVKAVDLDGDGVPEAIIRFTLGPRGGAETWIYRIERGQLVPIGPTDAEGHTLLGNPNVVDFEGNGVMELVDSSNVGDSRDEPVIAWEHYVLQKGTYIAAEPLDFYGLFFRDKAAPATKEETFAIPADALKKAYRVTIINGGFNGDSYRVSGGTVSLNGAVVSSQSDFNQQRRSWTVPVTLQASNILAVRLEGQPSGRIIVAIRHD